jgi:transcriptional regulator with XRE-family HTH domain
MMPLHSLEPTGRTYRPRKAGGAGPLATAIGARIRNLRVARGWSQRDLSRESGIPHNYISDVENGQRLMSVGMLVRFAGTLQVRAGLLIGE